MSPKGYTYIIDFLDRDWPVARKWSHGWKV